MRLHITSRGYLRIKCLIFQYAGDLIITKSDQALIFTAFYAGGLAIVMPGSYLCDVFGASNLVFYGAVFNVVGTFATPFIARSMDSWALVLLRFLMGCGQVRYLCIIDF